MKMKAKNLQIEVMSKKIKKLEDLLKVGQFV